MIVLSKCTEFLDSDNCRRSDLRESSLSRRSQQQVISEGGPPVNAIRIIARAIRLIIDGEGIVEVPLVPEVPYFA